MSFDWAFNCWQSTRFWNKESSRLLKSMRCCGLGAGEPFHRKFAIWKIGFAGSDSIYVYTRSNRHKSTWIRLTNQSLNSIQSLLQHQSFASIVEYFRCVNLLHNARTEFHFITAFALHWQHKWMDCAWVRYTFMRFAFNFKRFSLLQSLAVRGVCALHSFRFLVLLLCESISYSFLFCCSSGRFLQMWCGAFIAFFWTCTICRNYGCRS